MRNLIPQFIHEQYVRGATSGTFQAASIFVDISGFTPLTETLMRRRKDEAEVLSEALDEIFAPLVREVYARGGLIPLYAGDAFTALFPHDAETSPDAPLQAMLTAFFVQEFLAPDRQDRIFRTRHGDFAMGVRVGLSYGAVRWGIPGEGGMHAYYFRGEAVDGCALAEHQAARGEISADERILPFIRQHVSVEVIGGTSCCRLTACYLDLPPPGQIQPTLSRSDLTPFVLDAILDYAAEAEFREVCPVFLSFEEPDEVESLHGFTTDILRLAYDYGGTFSQIDFGDKGGMIILWFGAPISYENNVERAAEFLLALRRRGRSIRWRAGFTFGIAWAGIRGSTERCEFGAIGDVVNLAARLAMKAQWGELWVSAPAYQQLKESYWADARGTVQLKGKTGEIPVYRLWGKRELVESAYYTGGMVERQAELEQLASHLQPILAGQFTGIVYISGEAGTGKTRLVDELRQRLVLSTGVRWFLCPSDEILRQSLNPFQRFMRRHFDQSRDLTPEQNKLRFNAILDALIADLQTLAGRRPVRPGQRPPTDLVQELERTRSVLGALVGLRWEGSLYEELDPKLRFENTLGAFKALILAESLRRPVVLLLEDIHWLDSDSRDLVKLLVRNVEDHPLAVVCTSRYRDDGSRITIDVDPEVRQHEISLGALSAGGIRTLAEQMLGAEISGELAAFLAEKTVGNPFFVEQLVQDLNERRAICRTEDGGWSLAKESIVEVPATINAVLIARLDRLAAKVRDVVQTAAVLGREFEIQVLSRVLKGDQQLPDLVRQAESEMIWSALTEMRYIFRHALLRDAAYDMQMRARLRSLHRLAGSAIEQVYAGDLAPHYADLAHHYDRGDDVDKALMYARLAGEQAAAQFANSQALKHLDRALQLASTGEPGQRAAERYRILLAREKVFHLLGDREAQARDVAALEVIAGDLADDALRAQAILRRSHLCEAEGDFPAAISAAKAAIDLARAVGETVAEAKGHLGWGRALLRQGEYESGRDQMNQALTLARACLGAIAEVENGADVRRAHPGDTTAQPQGRDRDFGAGRAIEAAGARAVEADSLRSLGILHWHLLDNAAAQACHEQALGIYRELGDRSGEASSLNNLGIASAKYGKYDKVQGYFEEALAIQRVIGNRRGESHTLNNLGVVARNLGDYAMARRYYELSLAIKQEVDDRLGEVNTLINIGIIDHHQGELARARSYYERSLAICRQIGDRFGERSALDYLGLLAHHEGKDEAACDLCEQSLLITRELGDLPNQDSAYLYLGHALTGLGEYEAATGAYRKALQLRREAGHESQAIEAVAGLARVALAEGRTEQALAQVEEILKHLESGSLDGTTEPMRIHLTIYRVLGAADDPRAKEALISAHNQLRERVKKVSDESMRKSFLEKVAVNQEIIEEFETFRSSG